MFRSIKDYIIKEFILKYKYHTSLKTKLLIANLILTLVPAMLITSFAYHQLVSMATSKTLSSLNTLADQTRSNIAGTVKQLDSMINGIYDHEFLSSFIFMSHPYFYEQFYDIDAGIDSFEAILASFENHPIVSDIRIFMDDEHYRVMRKYTSNPTFETLDASRGTYWHGIFSSIEENSLLCPPMYLSPTETKVHGTHAMIRRLKASSTEAYVVIYFNQSAIQPILQQDLPYHNSVIYITNSRDALVASTNTTLSGTYYIPYEKIPKLIPSSGKQVRLQFAGENVYCGCKTIPGTDWRMVTAVPEINLVSEGNELLHNFLLIYILVLIICVVISQMISRSITSRISTVAKQMQQVQTNALPVHIDGYYGTDEISSLITSYNYMSDEINRLVEAQQQTANDLRHLEFRALQAQINPHFLYNTLDMINWMAKSGQTEQVSEAVNLLSRFYRLTLSRGNAMITVGEELQHVSLYVQLQNMRFQNSLHFYVDVADEMLEHTMPKLVFQPIVENSILHGILEKPVKEGNIVIMGWMENDTLVFVISDDGVGMPADKLATILDGKHDDSGSKQGSNIAISNTHKRIQLCYGSEYGLSYRSTPGVETEVEIRIPAVDAKLDISTVMISHF